MMKKNKSRRPRRKREKSEFEQKLLDLARVTRVVKGGRRFSFRATVVIGNKKGKVGLGVAKGADVSIAMGKAFAQAKKNVMMVKRTNTTVAFEVISKFDAAKVLIKPANEGTGIVAGGAMRAIIELAGIKDIVGKSLGRTSNKINVAKATMAALKELSEPLTGAPVEAEESSSSAKAMEDKKKAEKAEKSKEEKVEDKKEKKERK